MSKIRMVVVHDGSCYWGKGVGRILRELRKDYGISDPDRSLPKWKQVEWVAKQLRAIGVRLVLRIWRQGSRGAQEYVRLLNDYGVGRRITNRPPRTLAQIERNISREFGIPVRQGRGAAPAGFNIPGATIPAPQAGVDSITQHASQTIQRLRYGGRSTGRWIQDTMTGHVIWRTGGPNDPQSNG